MPNQPDPSRRIRRRVLTASVCISLPLAQKSQLDALLERNEATSISGIVQAALRRYLREMEQGAAEP